MLPHFPIKAYAVVALAIVDHHLYRFYGTTVPVNDQPTQFGAMVHALQTIRFEPIQRSDRRAAQAATTSGQPRPKFKVSAIIVYPPPAVGRGIEGVVHIEFGIDGHGRVLNMRQISSTSPFLDPGVSLFMRDASFEIPPDWRATGSEKLRFKLEFRFYMTAGSNGCRTAGALAAATQSDDITVCASRLMPGNM